MVQTSVYIYNNVNLDQLTGSSHSDLSIYSFVYSLQMIIYSAISYYLLESFQREILTHISLASLLWDIDKQNSPNTLFCLLF